MVVKVGGEYDDNTTDGAFYWRFLTYGSLAAGTNVVGSTGLEVAHAQSLLLVVLLLALSHPQL